VHTGFWEEDLRGKYDLKDVGVVGSTILKWIIISMMGRYGVD
jgi:hypothetical protein